MGGGGGWLGSQNWVRMYGEGFRTVGRGGGFKTSDSYIFLHIIYRPLSSFLCLFFFSYWSSLHISIFRPFLFFSWVVHLIVLFLADSLIMFFLRSAI